MLKVNFIMIKALTELYPRKITLNNMYIYTIGIAHACATITVTSFFQHVIQDRETRPTSMICSMNARLLYTHYNSILVQKIILCGLMTWQCPVNSRFT